VRKSDISQGIKDIIESARVYAEGRGFRIEVRDKELMNDMKKLININFHIRLNLNPA